MPWRINRPLEWLTRALQLRAGDAPRELDDSPVNVTLDAMQGGHALAAWDFVSADHGVGTVTTTIVACSADECALVQLNWSRTVAAAAMDARVQLRPPNNSPSRLILWGNPAVAAAVEYFGWYELGGGSGFQFVPPGWSLDFRTVQAGADTANVRAIVGKFPAGTKPF